MTYNARFGERGIRFGLALTNEIWRNVKKIEAQGEREAISHSLGFWLLSWKNAVLVWFAVVKVQVF